LSFVGNLEFLPVTEVLQVLSGTGRSGKLSVTTESDRGWIVLRGGKVIYAATTQVRQTLGSLLVGCGAIEREILEEALERQRRATSEVRLGTVLVEMEAIDRQTLRETVEGQIYRVIAEILEWSEGYFRFEPLELVDLGEVEVDIRELVIDGGVLAEEALLRASAIQGELLTELDRLDKLGDRATPPQESKTTLEPLLRRMPTAHFTGEIQAELLAAAARVGGRGVLFAVDREAFVPVGSFGCAIALSVAGGRDEIPLAERSLLRESVQRREIVTKDKLGRGEESLRSLLGEGDAEGPAAVPVEINDRVIFVLYLDTIRGKREVELVVLGDTARRVGLLIEERLVRQRREVQDAR